MATVEQRFWMKVEKSDKCWLFTGTPSQRYGQFWTGETLLGAHVYSWMLAHDRPVPEGREIHHLCGTQRCVRPDHLQAVTHRTNMRAADADYGIRSAVLSCPQGHPYTSDNLVPYYWEQGERRCRICLNARRRRRYHERMAARPNPVRGYGRRTKPGTR